MQTTIPKTEVFEGEGLGDGVGSGQSLPLLLQYSLNVHPAPLVHLFTCVQLPVRVQAESFVQSCP